MLITMLARNIYRVGQNDEPDGSLLSSVTFLLYIYSRYCLQVRFGRVWIIGAVNKWYGWYGTRDLISLSRHNIKTITAKKLAS